MRSALPRQGAGDFFVKTNDSGTSPGFHRRTGGHQADGLGGAWPRPGVRAPSKRAHRSAEEGQTGHRHRDPVAPSK